MPLLSALDTVRLWNFGRHFFSSRFSPQFRLDWDQHDAQGDLVAFDWGVLNPTAPRCFYHEWSTTASVILCIGYDDLPLQGLLGPLPRPREDILFWNWWFLDAWFGNGNRSHRPLRFVRFINRVLPPPPVYHFHRRAVFHFHQDLTQYPPEWTLEEIAHQHFLAYAVLNFWHIEVRGPPESDAQLEAREQADRHHHDERHEQELREVREELLLFLLTMERVLLWLNRLGVWVAWSDNYNLQMMHLYPDVFDSFPAAERRAEFDKGTIGHHTLGRSHRSGLTAPNPEGRGPSRAEGFFNRVLFRRNPFLFGPNRHFVRVWEREELDAFLRDEGLEPADFLGATLLPPPTPSPSPPPRDPTPPPITVLEEDFVPLPPSTPPEEQAWFHQIPLRGRHSEKRKRDLSDRGERPPTIKIPPSFGARLPERDLSKSPQHFPSESFRAKGAVVRSLHPACKLCVKRNRLCTLDQDPTKSLPSKTPRCCIPCNTTHATCTSWPDFFAAFGEHNGEILAGFRFDFWEHRGEGSYQPLIPDPRVSDLLRLSHATSFRELLVGFRPLQSNSNVASRRRSKQRPKQKPIVISSDLEGDVPLRKRRKTASHSYVHISSDEDEVADSVPAVEDMGNYELGDEDVSMPDAEVPIIDDPANYDPGLDPAPSSVPLAQQASSSRVTLDDPPQVAPSHFLGFRLRPVDPTSSTSTRNDYVEEIIQQVLSGSEDPHRTEAQLLFMSTVFGRAGNELGRRRRNGDTKGKGREE
ncbi:hypothetical protein C8R45DRAFT_923065 [Mycena sanguinolenta]|nr:hypothetical protein C8R45DRAFT_923065 [Mycena sanguinolenta]